MTVSKETLMAYVDGELDADERTTVEAAMTLDTEIAHEIERQQALRRQLQNAFDGVLHEPVPERLIAAVRTAPAAAVSGSSAGSIFPAAQTKVAGLSQARADRRENARRRWSLPEWSAMAACLVVGLFLGHQLLRSPTPFAMEGGGLVARGSLAAALSTRLASEPANDSVRVALSFRDRDGRYCRTFALGEGDAVAGLACRENDSWRVQVMARAAGKIGGDGYRMAGGDLPASVLQAVQERISGEPLDAAGETAARRNHWR